MANNFSFELNILKSQISQKIKDINYYKNKDWPGRVRVLERELTSLYKKLEEHNDSNFKTFDVDAATQSAWALIVFRIVIQLANLMFAHKLVRRLTSI